MTLLLLSFALGQGVNDTVHALVLCEHALYAGGTFTQAGGTNAKRIAKWDGVSWSALGSGVDDTNYLPQVRALALRGDDVYAGGAFSFAGSVQANNIAKWDGTNWTALDEGLERHYGELPVSALATHGNQLIAGGRFFWAGTLDADSLAAWDGTNWHELGGGVSGEVKALAVSADSVFAGGSFTVAAGLNNLAKWDGTAWSTPGAQPGEGILGESVAAVAVKDGAVWDGAGWSAQSGGTASDSAASRIQALAGCGPELYVGGSFQFAGGHPASDFCMLSSPIGLTISRVAGSLRVSWPVSIGHYRLEESPDLRSWTEEEAKPVRVGNTIELILEAPSAARMFYRLRED